MTSFSDYDRGWAACEAVMVSETSWNMIFAIAFIICLAFIGLLLAHSAIRELEDK